jgi:hypothetical protein
MLSPGFAHMGVSDDCHSAFLSPGIWGYLLFGRGWFRIAANAMPRSRRRAKNGVRMRRLTAERVLARGIDTMMAGQQKDGS